MSRAPSSRAQAGTTEARWVQWLLIGLALAFLLLFLLLSPNRQRNQQQQHLQAALERRRKSFLCGNQLGNPLHRLFHIDVVDGHAINVFLLPEMNGEGYRRYPCFDLRN